MKWKERISPYPWSACCLGRHKRSHYVFDGSGEGSICAMDSNDPEEEGYIEEGGVVTLDQRQANAQLIQAAPELLEALLSIENDDESIPKPIWDMRNKAIEKAIGKP